MSSVSVKFLIDDMLIKIKIRTVYQNEMTNPSKKSEVTGKCFSRKNDESVYCSSVRISVFSMPNLKSIVNIVHNIMMPKW